MIEIKIFNRKGRKGDSRPRTMTLKFANAYATPRCHIDKRSRDTKL